MAISWQRLKHGWAAVCAAFCFVCLPSNASADDIVLRAPDGSFEVSGPLIGFDGLSYRVDTRFGVLTLSTSAVECVSGCPGSGDVPVIRMVGAQSMARVLMPALVDVFAISLGVGIETTTDAETGAQVITLVAADAGPLARFLILGGTTAEGFTALAEGRADIVLADRPVTEDEAAQVAEAGLGDVTDPLRRRLMARKPLRIVVPRGQSVSSLDVSELVDVLSGETQRWAELGGGADAVISLHTTRDEAAQIAGRLAAVAEVLARPAETTSITVHDDLAGMVGALSEDPDAMAITSGTVFSGRALQVSNGCAADGAETAVAPDESVDPLLSQFWTYTAAPRLPDLARAFLVFATGPGAQRTIDRAGFVDKRPDPVPLADQGDRVARAILAAEDGAGFAALEDAIAALEGHDRLSLAFRFTPGTTELEPMSQSDVQSLAAFLDAGLFDGEELVFAGFSDGIGAAEANRSLSQDRAEVVRTAVQDLMVTNPNRAELIARGFGEVMPLACDESVWGRHVNRRVEVWVAPRF
ncbi:phosphate ABC transporter substrate-binding/OmpA family protein [Shimia ponticola]|uniref:phosphate ABC transporter substrate-binding/OmpA family protein n=1 Tax=Shimia ponticola TaxID=2582893 RepID=UPI0011BE426A|nr:phosphate ABC transporter substrate-binding/OmpA family protein [Shimia ponticola]